MNPSTEENHPDSLSSDDVSPDIGIAADASASHVDNGIIEPSASTDQNEANPYEVELNLSQDDNISETPSNASSSTSTAISQILNENQLHDINLRGMPVQKRLWRRFRGFMGWESKLLPFLYLSHTLSSISDRMWSFALPLIFASIYPSSLVPVSVYLFIEKGVCTLLGTYVGYLIDKKPRLPVLLLGLGLQNLCVALSALALFFLHLSETGDTTDRVIYFPFANLWCFLFWLLSTIFGTIAAVMSMITDISVMRDWTVVIAAHHNLQLTNMNSVMRRIDLLTNIFAPLIYGVIIWVLKVRLSILIITVWNIVSFFPEFFLLLYVYRQTPPLGALKTAVKKQQGLLRTLVSGWTVYLTQLVTIPSITYVMLYCTVLSSGVLILTYLGSIGMHEMGITAFRVFASIFGVIATFVSPYFIRVWGVVRGGIIGFWLQVVCVFLAVSIYIVGYLFFNQMWCVYIFLMLVVFSRLGLWVFDLSESEIMQVGIKEEDRGSVNAIERSLTKLAELFMFILSILVAAPKYFVILALASCMNVLVAAILYTLWSVVKGGKFMDLVRQQSVPPDQEEEMEELKEESLEALSDSGALHRELEDVRNMDQVAESEHLSPLMDKEEPDHAEEEPQDSPPSQL